MAKGKTTKKAVKNEEIKDTKKIEKLEVEEKDVKEETTNEVEEKADEKVEVMSLDNTPVDPIVVENDDEIIPNKFVPTPKVAKQNNKKLMVHNGRVYKVLNNGRGMYADNGETFNLNEIK
nr:MAG TPA: hypothetical protein [Caudoviricetes sp.]